MIEKLIEKLIDSLDRNTAALESAAGKSVSSGNTSSAKSESSDEKVAQKKTYAFFPETKTAQIIEKGEVVPEGANCVQKTQWVTLSKKHKFDPETGKPLEEKSEEKEEVITKQGKSLFNDDELKEEADIDAELNELNGDSDDDDDGLLDGLMDDDEPESSLTLADVKKMCVHIVKNVSGGKAIVSKILKEKAGGSFDNATDDDIKPIHKAILEAAKKHDFEI